MHQLSYLRVHDLYFGDQVRPRKKTHGYVHKNWVQTLLRPPSSSLEVSLSVCCLLYPICRALLLSWYQETHDRSWIFLITVWQIFESKVLLGGIAHLHSDHYPLSPIVLPEGEDDAFQDILQGGQLPQKLYTRGMIKRNETACRWHYWSMSDFCTRDHVVQILKTRGFSCRSYKGPTTFSYPTCTSRERWVTCRSHVLQHSIQCQSANLSLFKSTGTTWQTFTTTRDVVALANWVFFNRVASSTQTVVCKGEHSPLKERNIFMSKITTFMPDHHEMEPCVVCLKQGDCSFV